MVLAAMYNIDVLVKTLQGTEQSCGIWAPILFQHEFLSCLTSFLKDHYYLPKRKKSNLDQYTDELIKNKRDRYRLIRLLSPKMCF